MLLMEMRMVVMVIRVEFQHGKYIRVSFDQLTWISLFDNNSRFTALDGIIHWFTWILLNTWDH